MTELFSLFEVDDAVLVESFCLANDVCGLVLSSLHFAGWERGGSDIVEVDLGKGEVSSAIGGLDSVGVFAHVLANALAVLVLIFPLVHVVVRAFVLKPA